MNRRPRIGVTTSSGGGRYMWWFYWLALELSGARPVRLIAPLPARHLSGFDAFIIGGGDDIGAELYNGEPALDVRIDPDRDELELAALKRADIEGLPVLGVCRGAQMINVFRGGTLHQDVRAVYDGMPNLWTPLPTKTVHFEQDTLLGSIFGREALRVNSLHRQAVDRLGHGLRVAARDEFGVIQAIEDRDVPFRIGLQWHPEFLIYQRTHRRLFRAFLDAVRAARTRRNRPDAADRSDEPAAHANSPASTI